jgi:hypothetical protein
MLILTYCTWLRPLALIIIVTPPVNLCIQYDMYNFPDEFLYHEIQEGLVGILSVRRSALKH